MRDGEDKRTNVLVIGAGGNFGKCLVECLLRDGGYNVHCLDSYVPFAENRNSEVCSYIQADICSYEDMLLSMRGVQAVFHAGSHHSFLKKPDFYHTNVTGTENVVRACRECNVKRLIYTSSASVVVGKKWNQQQADEASPYPKSHRNVYLASIATAEQLVLSCSGIDGLVTCAMRLAPVICSLNDPFIESLLNQSMFLLKNASHGVSLVGADAGAQAHILTEKKLCNSTTSIAAGKAYNLGNETRVLYSDLIGKLASDNVTIWGQPPPTEVSKWVLTLLAYINYYCYMMTGVLLFNKIISPLLLDMHTTEQSFSSVRAHSELGWEDKAEWQEVIASLVNTYNAKQETKKEQ